MKYRRLIFVIVMLLAGSSFALENNPETNASQTSRPDTNEIQAPEAAPSPGQRRVTLPAPATYKPLSVVGPDYVLKINVPPDWKADAVTSAVKMNANLVLIKKTDKSADTAKILIRVRVNRKTDENISADLEHNMKSYKTQHPRADFLDFPSAHPSYKLVSKVFIQRAELYEYLTYLNPGPSQKSFIALSMEKFTRDADPEEIVIFHEIVKSVELIKKK